MSTPLSSTISVFVPSEHQTKIFDFALHGTGSAIVIAVAGAGKSTTLVQMFHRLPSDPILMLAFNKDIVTAITPKVPKNVKCATGHSVGYSVWQKFVGGKVNVDQNKTRTIMQNIMSERDLENYGSFVAKMVGLAKSVGMGHLVPNTVDQWAALSAHYDILPDCENANIEYGIEIAREVLAIGIEYAHEGIDFDDMLFMPLIKGLAFPQYGLVCLDEAQDTNGVQRALIKRMLKPGGRLIAVGDPCQAIYGFRGADSSAMELIKQDFNAIELYLTVSYRCPQAVVAHAQSIVPYIQASDKAPQGLVCHNPGTEIDGKFVAQAFRPTDAILCRNTAPLVTLAYVLLARFVPCQILGRDIGKGLTALIKKLNAHGIDALITKLEEFEKREVAKCLSKDETSKAEAISDKCRCIHLFIGALKETERTVPALIASIDAMFSDNSNRGILTLCTVHKAKGLEWERVYILDAGKYMPSKWARQEWQQQQERNLQYVAFTRAKLELCFVDTEHLTERLAAQTPQAPAIVERKEPQKSSNLPATGNVAQPADVAATATTIRAGDHVRVVKGRNVPIGTTAIVEQVKADAWTTVVIKEANGAIHRTYAKNLEKVQPALVQQEFAA